jgi:UDP-arabinose 4-epimerase
LALAVTGKLDNHFTALWDHGHIKSWSRRTLGRRTVESGFETCEIHFAGRSYPLPKQMLIVATKATQTSAMPPDPFAGDTIGGARQTRGSQPNPRILVSEQNILVVGGAGYIGSHCCKALARAGWLPVTYDNLVYGHEWAVKWGPLERGDILDRDRLDQVMTAHRPSAILHFAAFAYVGESVVDPGKYYRNNVAGSLNLLEAARDHEIERFVFSSSCATYGIPVSVPIGENSPQRPVSPYGASKLMVERILRDFDAAHGLRSIALRYFNAAGADPDGEIGENHDPETHLIPLALDAAAGRRPNLTVFGADYDTPDGTCIRDYIHVSDLADAHVQALRALEAGAETAAYNLGVGSGYSVLEVIDAVTCAVGRRPPIAMGARRPGDPAVLVCDASRARATLGWSPKFLRLEEIVGSAWSWSERSAAYASRSAPPDDPSKTATRA